MRPFTLVLCLILFSHAPAWGAEFDAVLSLRPSTEASCVAVEVPTPGGQAVTALRWWHNDVDAVFPSVLLMEGQPGTPPDLEDASLILMEVSGASLAWGELDLGGPVTSSTGYAYAVFFFPVGQSTSGLGEGPGIGVKEQAGPSFYITGDGMHWAQFDPEFALGVEPVYASSKVQPRVLRDIHAELIEERPKQSQTLAFHAPRPNPFNPKVTLSFTLPKSEDVRLTILDVRGRVVHTVVSARFPSGTHEFVWSGRDTGGVEVASGVYFARLSAGEQLEQRRIVLIR